MTATVPFLDLKAAYTELADDIDAAVARVVRSGHYIGGPEVERFETAFAAYCQADHCIGVGNGLDALRLVLEAMKIGAGDESSCRRTPSSPPGWRSRRPARRRCRWSPIRHVQHRSVANRAAIGPRTRAIMPVHLYGQPADLGPILEVARRHGQRVIEDAAQAQAHATAAVGSARTPTRSAGASTPARTSARSATPARSPPTMPSSPRGLRMLGNYGSSVKYVHELQGVNSRLDPIQAAVLGVKLAWLDTWNDRRRAIAARYLDALPRESLVLPGVSDWPSRSGTCSSFVTATGTRCRSGSPRWASAR
jgi:dTDP-4-amino-4,6-dideoxygalactose transaminase